MSSKKESEEQIKKIMGTGIVSEAVRHPYLPLAEKTIWIEFDTEANAEKFRNLLIYARTISGKIITWSRREGKRVSIQYEE